MLLFYVVYSFFVFTYVGSVDQHVSTQIYNGDDSLINVSHPFLIKIIVEVLPGLKDSNDLNMPSPSTEILNKVKYRKNEMEH